jgi:CelD/BcsL family acetyltransferase involved in cellulose biosynthesis
MGDRLELTRLDWAAALAAADEWERVRREAPTERVFLTPEWLETWWRHLGPGGRPSLLAVRRASRMMALAPLYRSRIGPSGLVALRPLGIGVSDYLDVLLPAEPDERRACLATLLDGLLARPSGWDALDLPNLPGESPTIEDITLLARGRGLPCVVLPGYARPAVALEGTWDGYLKTRSSRFRYNLRSRLRRLGQLGDVRFRMVPTAELPEALAALVELHARRWAGQRTATIFSSSARGRAFYAEASRRYADRGLLDLTLLEVGGRTVAGCLSFVDRETFYYYMPAWEPELAAYAPSSLLLAHLLEAAFARGLRRFDFMLGEEPYKAQWATEERRTMQLVIGNRGARGCAAFATVVSWQRLRARARASTILQRARRYGVAAAISHQLATFSNRDRSPIADR